MTTDASSTVEDWRQWHEHRVETVSAPYGPLALTGTHWLADHPDGRLADTPGRWVQTSDGVLLTASAEDALTVDGAPFSGEVRLSADLGPAAGARVGHGERRFVVLVREGVWGVRDFGPASEARRAFKGIEATAYDTRWAVPGRFTPYDEDRTIRVDNGDGLRRQLVHQQATFAPSRRPARPLAAPAESPSTSSTRASGRHTESTHRTPLLDGQTLPAGALEGCRLDHPGSATPRRHQPLCGGRHFAALSRRPSTPRKRVMLRLAMHRTMRRVLIRGDPNGTPRARGRVGLHSGRAGADVPGVGPGRRILALGRFADATSEDSSYRFRFLRPAAPDTRGRTTVDFNRAVLPPCAFADHFVCPFPPPGNTLELAVAAGGAQSALTAPGEAIRPDRRKGNTPAAPRVHTESSHARCEINFPW